MNMKSLVLFSAFAAIAFACGTGAPNEAAETVDETQEKEDVSKIEEEHKLFRAEYADSVNQGLIADDTFKGSARREAKGSIGNANITVNYGSPGKRGRVLWNGLVSYDQVWVSGSHWATAVTFGADVKVDGTTVPAGTYGFFSIPGREQWTLILNENFDQHLADAYDESLDVVRVQVTPEMIETPVQRLSYSIASANERAGSIVLEWDEIRVRMPVEVIE